MLQVNLDGSDEIALDADRKLELGGELMHIDSNRYLCAAVLDSTAFHLVLLLQASHTTLCARRSG